MGFKIMKCPACGGDLNIETNRDFLFCQFCGAKLMKDDQRIVIEHIERKIDEAEIEKHKLEREEASASRVSKKKMRKLAGIFFVVGAILVGIGSSKIGSSSFALIGEMALIAALFLFVSGDVDINKRDQQK